MRTVAVAVTILLLTGCTAPASYGPGDGSGVQQVYGALSEIVAIVFGAPLSSPPTEDRSNKILWVSHQPAAIRGDLKISAVLDGTGERAEHTVPRCGDGDLAIPDVRPKL